MFTSIIARLFKNPILFLFIGGMSAMACCVILALKLERTHHQLEIAKQTIQQYQQAQALSESASTKLSKHKEATRNEAERQNKIANEALESHKDWADAFLPDDIIRMFNKATTGSDSVSPTDGVAR